MEMTSLVIAIATLALSLLGHIITTVWWASKITNILEISRGDIKELLIDMKNVNTTYVRKEDYIREMTEIKNSIDAAWRGIDEINKST